MNLKKKSATQPGTKKLAVTRETLRRLDRASLEEVAGGTVRKTTKYITNITQSWC